jgi:hypothetical protein
MRILTAAWHFALRWRYGVLLIVATIVFAQLYELRFGDWLFLEYVGRVALHHHGYPGGWSTVLHVYTDMPKVQMGPPALLAALPLQLLSPRTGSALGALTMMLAMVACVALIERTALLVGVPSSRTRPAALIGGLLLTPAWAILAVTSMHMDDVIVLTAIIAALPCLLRQRWWAAAALLGTAVATKPWAVVVVPVLFALPRRGVARAALVLVGVALLWWVPFFLADPNTAAAVGGVHVPVNPNSTFGLFGYDMHGPLRLCNAVFGCRPPAPSWLRPLQFGLGVLLAGLAVRRGRWLAAPLVGLTVRVLLDAQAWGYYGAGPVLAALTWDVCQGRRVPRWALLVAAGEYSGFVVNSNKAEAAIRLVMCLVVVYWFALRRRTTGSPPEDAATTAGAKVDSVRQPVAATA